MVGEYGGLVWEVETVARLSNHSELVMLHGILDVSAETDTCTEHEVAWRVQCFDSASYWQSAAWSDRGDMVVSRSRIDYPDCLVPAKGHKACFSASSAWQADMMSLTHTGARSWSSANSKQSLDDLLKKCPKADYGSCD